MKKILIVDDDPICQTIIRSRLEGQGYDLKIAEDGMEALEFMQEELPDLVITDTCMPMCDGIDLLELTKFRWPKLPVIIFFSGYPARKDVNNKYLTRLGANRVFSKPRGFYNLQAEVGELLAQEPTWQVINSRVDNVVAI